MKATIAAWVLVLFSCAALERDNPADPGSDAYDPGLAGGIPAPSTFREIAVTYDYVNFEWDPVAEADHYEVTRHRQPDGPSEIDPPFVTGQPHMEDNGVEPGVQYYYRVVSVASGGQGSEPSEPFPVKTPPTPALLVVYPAGGEILAVGEPLNIRWKVNAPGISAVGVQLIREDGLEINDIAPGPIQRQDSTNFVWTPTAVHKGPDCKVNVYDHADEGVHAMSPFFEIK
ncbi:MAG: hypothetical protein GF418_06000 [Chitinivibrionales bacterium]|nr:hypothetical protein [Chitinivibrionales bacterium]MBD3395164.1 hypothetical protein [Chitinivibrionales bacterium]